MISRSPAATIAPIAAASAQMPSGNEAFSTLHPAKMRPEEVRTAAPTRKPEYGAWALACTARAVSSRSSGDAMATEANPSRTLTAVTERPTSYRQTQFRRPPGSTELLLVRHGESEALVEGRPFPRVDGPRRSRAGPRGQRQAERVAERLAGQPSTPST